MLACFESGIDVGAANTAEGYSKSLPAVLSLALAAHYGQRAVKRSRVARGWLDKERSRWHSRAARALTLVGHGLQGIEGGNRMCILCMLAYTCIHPRPMQYRPINDVAPSFAASRLSVDGSPGGLTLCAPLELSLSESEKALGTFRSALVCMSACLTVCDCDRASVGS